MKFSFIAICLLLFMAPRIMAQQTQSNQRVVPAAQQAPQQVPQDTKISPTQMIALANKSIGEIQENLITNNWFFYAATEEKEGAYGFAKFVYDRPNFKYGDGAEYLLVYYYSEVADSQALELKFNNKNTFESFNIQILNLKYKLASSTVKDGNIIKVYKKGSKYIEVTIPSSLDGGGAFKYLFCKKSNYKKIRGK